MRIVVDTMVIISGAKVSTSYSSQIMQLWEQKYVELASSEPILSELRRVMRYPDVQKVLSFTEAQIDQYIRKIRQGAYMVPSTTPITVSLDPNDDMFFICAVEANADYVVSKDKKHVLAVGSYQGIRTVTPQDFIEQIIRVEKAA